MRLAPLLFCAAALAGCATTPPPPQSAAAPTVPAAAVRPAPAAAPAPITLEALLAKQIYQMTPQEVDRYIAWVHQAEPDLRKRIAAIGRKNIGQPYILNLLGEFPFQVHDNLPMFSLDHSDCVVFSEHTYAMALSESWEEFFWMLQRIRYKDGVVGVATRNHYTEVDWDVNNSWLVTDVSAELAGPGGPAYPLTVDRSNFLRTRHHTETNLPVQTTAQPYVAKERVAAIAAQLRDGDFVNVISTRNGEFWASHVGLVVTAANGERHFLNSIEPAVREETFDAFIARAAEREARAAREGRNVQKLVGFKFLRLNENIVVPPAAPQPRPVKVAAAAR